MDHWVGNADLKNLSDHQPYFDSAVSDVIFLCPILTAPFDIFSKKCKLGFLNFFREELKDRFVLFEGEKCLQARIFRG